jgi:simple sugar transport system permease protein
VAFSVPLVFGALSGVLCERAGVINIAIEGQLLSGAFTAAVIASITDNLWLGLVMASVAGVGVSVLLALFAIRYVVDQIIVGVVLNVLVIGLTGFLYGKVLTQEQDVYNQPGTFGRIAVPGLVEIPVIGPMLFNQTIFVYLMYAAVVAVHIALFSTRWGLRVRAVGEHPTAADTVGIKVNRVRVQNVLLGGAVAGLGGAFFTLGSVGAFGREMTAGQGFIALAAMIFGRWSPIGALFAALLFGFANQLQGTLGVIGTSIPSEFMLMAPYLATIFAVAGLVGRVRAPAADGQPYVKA